MGHWKQQDPREVIAITLSLLATNPRYAAVVPQVRAILEAQRRAAVPQENEVAEAVFREATTHMAVSEALDPEIEEPKAACNGLEQPMKSAEAVPEGRPELVAVSVEQNSERTLESDGGRGRRRRPGPQRRRRALRLSGACAGASRAPQVRLLLRQGGFGSRGHGRSRRRGRPPDGRPPDGRWRGRSPDAGGVRGRSAASPPAAGSGLADRRGSLDGATAREGVQSHAGDCLPHR